MNIFKKAFIDNLFIKILAVVLAAFTYLYVHREDMTQKRLPGVNVRVAGLPSEWRITDISYEKVDLIIAGPRLKLDLLNNRNVYIELSMEGIDFNEKGGEFNETFEISRKTVKGLDYDVGLNLRDKDVSQIQVKTAMYITKPLEVKIKTVGKPAPGYEILWSEVTPNVVEVTGPVNIIKYEDNIPTIEVNIMGRKDNLDLYTGLDVVYLKEDKSAVFECSHKVNVSIGIGPKPSQKKIIGIPVRVLKTLDKAWIIKTEPSVVDVTVVGNDFELERFNKSNIKAYIDSDDLGNSPGEYTDIVVEFFIVGDWRSIRIRDSISVKAELSVK